MRKIEWCGCDGTAMTLGGGGGDDDDVNVNAYLELKPTNKQTCIRCAHTTVVTIFCGLQSTTN